MFLFVGLSLIAVSTAIVIVDHTKVINDTMFGFIDWGGIGLTVLGGIGLAKEYRNDNKIIRKSYQ